MTDAVPRRWRIAIVSAAATAFLAKLLLALNTYGTNDVYAWERFAHWSRLFGSGLYSIDAAFNHPPSMIHALAAMTWLAKATGIFFPFWLRLPAIVADAAGCYLVYRMFEERLGDPHVRWTLLLLAGSPVLLLVSGFHGNTDPVVMFFLLLAVFFEQRRKPDWAAGAAFGAAMCVKVLPLIVLPVFFFQLRGLRRRAIFLASAGAVMCVCWSPYLFRDPVAIYHQVIGYPSIYGHWGLTWLACQFAWFRDSWHDAFQRYGAYVVLGVITVAAFIINRREERPPLYTQAGAAFFFFLAAANGFGVQYLAWLAPWTVGLGVVPAGFFTLASGTFLLLVYNWWSGGFPWYLADSNYVGDFAGHLDYSLTVCWISVIVLAGAVWRRKHATFPDWKTGGLLAAMAAALIFFPAWKQAARTDARTYPPANDHAAVIAIHADEYAQLSQAYFKLGRYNDAIVAARTGVALDASVLSAWNTLARACIAAGRWEEALNAANNAIRISPEDAVANATLVELYSRR